ncbi:MAG: septum formation initiator family protein [Clostridia bacterium]|nr:septum formation initiator family protein [Clostridia bacterium]
MNRNTNRRTRQEQRRRANRTLMIAFAVVLFVGMFAQVFMIARLSRQNKDMRAVELEIRDLNANAENLKLALNQLGDLELVAARAEKLGMKTPGEGQIRVVNLPDVVGNTSAQSAENTSAEEMNQ